MAVEESTRALCECGCGLPAPIARDTNPKWGHVKGKPCRFRLGHGTPRKYALRAGQQYGRWTLIQPIQPTAGVKEQWLCRCECGAVRNVLVGNLTSGSSLSCGCVRASKLRHIMKHRHDDKTHCVHGHPYTKDNVIVRRFAAGQIQRACKTCSRLTVRLKHAEHRQLILSFKKKCARCPETHPWCLEFHHRDPKTKLFLPNAAKKRSLGALLAEIAKCDVLCSNCHRKLHYEERQRRKTTAA